MPKMSQRPKVCPWCKGKHLSPKPENSKILVCRNCGTEMETEILEVVIQDPTGTFIRE